MFITVFAIINSILLSFDQKKTTLQIYSIAFSSMCFIFLQFVQSFVPFVFLFESATFFFSCYFFIPFSFPFFSPSECIIYDFYRFIFFSFDPSSFSIQWHQNWWMIDESIKSISKWLHEILMCTRFLCCGLLLSAQNLLKSKNRLKSIYNFTNHKYRSISWTRIHFAFQEIKI